MKYQIVKVTKATIKSSSDKSLYRIVYRMTIGSTSADSHLYLPAMDELDAYYRACWEIEKLMDEKEVRDGDEVRATKRHGDEVRATKRQGNLKATAQ